MDEKEMEERKLAHRPRSRFGNFEEETFEDLAEIPPRTVITITSSVGDPIGNFRPNLIQMGEIGRNMAQGVSLASYQRGMAASPRDEKQPQVLYGPGEETGF